MNILDLKLKMRNSNLRFQYVLPLPASASICLTLTLNSFACERGNMRSLNFHTVVTYLGALLVRHQVKMCVMNVVEERASNREAETLETESIPQGAYRD
jgi:hypothetical protein